MSPEVPSFAATSPLLTDAYLFARDAHDGGRTSIEHPAAVAALLSEAGYPEHVVATALLHDVIEDRPQKADELARRFGPDVARLVGRLTEDPHIDGFRERKRELRRRAAGDSPTAAAIFAADKLASARALNASDDLPDPEKLDHYERSLSDLRRTHPEVPFLGELEEQVARLRARAARQPAR